MLGLYIWLSIITIAVFILFVFKIKDIKTENEHFVDNKFCEIENKLDSLSEDINTLHTTQHRNNKNNK